MVRARTERVVVSGLSISGDIDGFVVHWKTWVTRGAELTLIGGLAMMDHGICLWTCYNVGS